MRLVLIFQKCAWSSLEINIFLSLAPQDAPRSVSCNLFAFFPLHTLSFTSSKPSGDCSDIQSSPFFVNVLCFVLFLFFPFVWIAVCFTFSIHVLTPVTRKDRDAEITVDVRKIILAFLYFRLLSLRSTGSLIFLSLSLLTQPFCSLVVYALKKARLEEQTMGILKFSLLSNFFQKTLWLPCQDLSWFHFSKSIDLASRWQPHNHSWFR